MNKGDLKEPNKNPLLASRGNADMQPFYVIMSLLHHQLPAQMGSLLGSSVALQYLDCVQDESALLRLNFWLGYALHEGK